jgi:DNA-binding NarL/FixJ family response regulator
MDVNLPDGNGIDATAAVLDVHPDTAVIVLTAHADPMFALRAAEAGASGFVPKDVRMAKIVAAVRAVMAGEPAMDPTLLHAVLVHAAAAGPADPAAPPPALGADDVALLELLAQGIDSAGLAAKLGLDGAETAVRVAALVGRLGARSRLEAVVCAARMGLLDPTAA